MPNSLILDGARPEPPNWTRSQWTLGQARQVNLCPAAATNGNLSYDFTWHHNIPWRVLRDSFNVVMVFCSWTVVGALLDLYGMRLSPDIRKRIRNLRKALALHNQSNDDQPDEKHAGGATYAKWVERFGRGPGSLLEPLKLEDQLTTEHVDELRQSVAWQRWNIVEGPKESIRVDDPGSDDFDDFRVADPDHFDRYEDVHQLHEVLSDIEADYQRNKALVTSTHKMLTWSAKLQPLMPRMQSLINEPLIMFDPALWRTAAHIGNPKQKDIGGKTYYEVRLRRADEK
jgi:hypothetical protein